MRPAILATLIVLGTSDAAAQESLAAMKCSKFQAIERDTGAENVLEWLIAGVQTGMALTFELYAEKLPKEDLFSPEAARLGLSLAAMIQARPKELEHLVLAECARDPNRTLADALMGTFAKRFERSPK